METVEVINRKESSYSGKPNNRQAAISEEKMQIVINNYFKSECNVDTSIRQAFEKGFRIGVKKGLTAQPEIIRCKDCEWGDIYVSDGNRYCYCMMSDPRIRTADDFCSYAEREEA